MLTTDTWAVVAIDSGIVTVECPFMLQNGTMAISVEEIGECGVGDIFSTESGGWVYLKYSELNDLNNEGRKIFYNYINKRGFRYSFAERYGFIADT